MHILWSLATLLVAASAATGLYYPRNASLGTAYGGLAGVLPELFGGGLYSRQSCPDPGFDVCPDGLICCQTGYTCCSDNTCCAPGLYCFNGVDGLSCCQNGQVCTGPPSGCNESGFVLCPNDDFCCLPGQTCFRDANNVPECLPGSTKPPQMITTTPAPPHMITTTPAPPQMITTTPLPPQMMTTTAPVPPPVMSTTTTLLTTPITTIPPHVQTTTPLPAATTFSPSPNARNVTVGASDPSIVYHGNWTPKSSTCNSTASSVNMESNGSGNSLGYGFTGTAIYIAIQENPNAGVYSVAIDGVVTQQNGYSVATICQIGFEQTGLSNVQHTITVTPNVGVFDLDHIIITTQPAASPTSSASVCVPLTVMYTIVGVTLWTILCRRREKSSDHLSFGGTHSMSEEVEYEGLPPNAGLAVSMLAGGLAGITEHAVMFPVDSIKTRMQVFATSSAAVYTGIGNAFARISSTEGMRALWRGVTSVILGAGPAHAVHFGVYEAVKDLAGGNDPGNQWLATSFAGASATIASDALMNPFDVIKQRMQVHRSEFRSVFRCAHVVYRNEGLSAFYVSYPTTLTMTIPFTAAQFTVYEQMKKLLNPSGTYSPVTHIIAGGVAGGVAAGVTTPLDVAKTLLQTRGTSREQDIRNARGMGDAFRIIWRRDGLKGFTRGLAPRILTFMPSNALCWLSYEFFKAAIRDY